MHTPAYIHTDRHTNKHTNKHKTKTNAKEGRSGRPVYRKSLLTRFMKVSCVVLCRRPVGVWSPRPRLGAQVAFPLGSRGLRAECLAGCGVGRLFGVEPTVRRVGSGGGGRCFPRHRVRVLCGRLTLLSSLWRRVRRLGCGRERARSRFVASRRGGAALRSGTPRIWEASQARGCSSPRGAPGADRCLQWSTSSGGCCPAVLVPVVLSRTWGEGSTVCRTGARGSPALLPQLKGAELLGPRGSLLPNVVAILPHSGPSC